MSRDPNSSYYDAGGIETLDIIKAKLTSKQYQGYLLGNALKYSCRLMHKNTGEGRLRDAMKAKNYMSWLADELLADSLIEEDPTESQSSEAKNYIHPINKHPAMNHAELECNKNSK